MSRVRFIDPQDLSDIDDPYYDPNNCGGCETCYSIFGYTPSPIRCWTTRLEDLPDLAEYADWVAANE